MFPKCVWSILRQRCFIEREIWFFNLTPTLLMQLEFSLWTISCLECLERMLWSWSFIRNRTVITEILLNLMLKKILLLQYHILMLSSFKRFLGEALSSETICFFRNSSWLLWESVEILTNDLFFKIVNLCENFLYSLSWKTKVLLIRKFKQFIINLLFTLKILNKFAYFLVLL